MTTMPRRPKTLPEAAATLWKQVCSHLTDAGSPPTPAQYPVIEAYCFAILRLETMRAAAMAVDPLDKEWQSLARLLQAEEKQMLAMATELKLTPRAAAAQSAGPKGGRSPGTGTSALRSQKAAGSDIHWLEAARNGA
jgi:phage terminase small subunit